ncbi:MAG: hypothetical protein LJE61_00945 [Thiocapsa sp.]|jgi:hypothetical protein|nr:hypothetical protein [Thiocapsa sp.]MCG6897032.1 hypothetical protein [Thiocapsa sp.]MCG6983755.1 hypothetical protein [Thiocapsa sp.]
MKLDERERRLLDLIEEYGESECRALLGRARSEAATLTAAAYRRARTELHQRVLAERANARARLHAARAEHETRSRATGDRANTRLLELAWPQLRETLAARWTDPDVRRTWAGHYLEQARHLLPRGLWTVRHPPDWPASEWAPLAAGLTKFLGQAPHFVADGGLSAGLIIETEGALLDATLAGLLRDRRRVEARLLALLARRPDSEGARP